MAKVGIVLEENNNNEIFVYGNSALAVFFKILKINQKKGFFEYKTFIVRTEKCKQNMRIENTFNGITSGIMKLYNDEKDKKEENNEQDIINDIEKKDLTIFNIKYKKKTNKIITSTSPYSLLTYVEEYDSFDNNEYNREKILKIVEKQAGKLKNKRTELTYDSMQAIVFLMAAGIIPAVIDAMVGPKVFASFYISFIGCSIVKGVKMIIKYSINYISPISSIKKIIKDSEKNVIKSKEKVVLQPQRLGPPGLVVNEKTISTGRIKRKE